MDARTIQPLGDVWIDIRRTPMGSFPASDASRHTRLHEWWRDRLPALRAGGARTATSSGLPSTPQRLISASSGSS